MKIAIVMGCNHYEGSSGDDLTAYASMTQATQVAWELNNYDAIKESRDNKLQFVSMEDEYKYQSIYDYFIVKEVEVIEWVVSLKALTGLSERQLVSV